MKSYVMEFLGSFFLMYAVIFSGEPWAIGLIFAAMIYIGRHISGGYYNPAVTIAAWMRNAVSVQDVLWYCAAQIAGASVAAFYFWFVSGDYFMLELPADIIFFDSAVREILGTFVLSLVVLTLATTARYSTTNKLGLIAGLTLAALCTLGGLYNPALFLGAMLCKMAGFGAPTPYNILTFVVSPVVGGVIAAYLCDYLNPREVYPREV